MRQMLQPGCNQKKITMASSKVFLFTFKTIKDGSHPILLQLIKDRRRKMITLGTAFANLWNFEKEIPSNKHPQAKELRSLIKKKKNAAEKTIIELDGIGKPYTVEDIAEKLDLVKSSTSFSDYPILKNI